MKLIDKVFGSYSQNQIKKLRPTIDKIEGMAQRFAELSDAEMRAMTDTLKARIADGETLDDILPEAFALVREAAARVLGKRPFTVQLMGGIVLHQGRIAEMKTGEGKTLTVTMPAYLNALAGKGVHVVTVNEYLARMGAEEMGRVFSFLGLSTGLVIHAMSKEEKQAAYNSDILYSTNHELGFDYLRDNKATYKNQVVHRDFDFAIVDEVDSILVDEARTPLIISGPGEEVSDLYDRTDKLVRRMKQHRIKKLGSKEDSEGEDIDGDYIVDEQNKSVLLTARGIKKCEEYFAIDNLSDSENSTIAHHVNQAIHAYGLKQRDEDYVVQDNKVLIVDEYTGRIKPSSRYSNGLHQAIEAKEGIKIDRENMTLATITYQNYFRMYKKLSGMTGTALTEKKEFEEIYNLDVVEIPTNRPMIREDHNDMVFKNAKSKQNAIVEQIKECHAKGQPVLVGTVTVDKSEELSVRLKKEGIKHTVLNAKYHDKEAEIVALAGKLGRVTIATNMAGRGTDILLGGNAEHMAKAEMRKQEYPEEVIGLAVGSSQSVSDEVLKARGVYKDLYEKYRREIEPEYKEVVSAGGLFILGTERHDSRRIDNQLRGRAGRQGDPGESRFFISMEDDLLRLFGSDRIHGMVDTIWRDEEQAVDIKMISNMIETAQKRLEGDNFQRRYQTLNFDDVMNQQRIIIYKQRSEVLDGKNMHETILTMIDKWVADAVGTYMGGEEASWDVAGLRQQYMGIVFREDDLKEPAGQTPEGVTELMHQRIAETIAAKQEMFSPEKTGVDFSEVERVVLLNNVDRKWEEHLDAMDDLRGSVGLHAHAQRNPLNEYRIAGGDMFDEMVSAIREDTIRMLLAVQPNQNVERRSGARITREGMANAPGAMPAPQAGGPIQQPKVIKKEDRIGDNDECPCGSGRKYKKCCGLK
ncbi:MAG: preprotein translocase subunit SecA [Oscillospiraceae bacterium]|nr:preprotein translocase subunit SecA [Oscillospiraceae bacterium]